MMKEINTHGLIVDFGKHRGELWTRVPVGYLFWIVNTRHTSSDIAQAEIDRRGAQRPTVDVSGHAIDRASLELRTYWLKDRKEREGIYSWLCRKAQEALEHGRTDKQGVIRLGGIRFVFERETQWPVLKTVTPGNGLRIRP